MSRVTTTTIYESHGKVRDALLGIIENAYSLVHNVDGYGWLEIGHCSVEDSADGQFTLIVVHGRTDSRGIRPLLTFELTGDSAVHVVADSSENEPLLQGYIRRILMELQPNQIDAMPMQANTPMKPPPKPPEPKRRGGRIERWLDWYHAMLDSGFKCTLKEVANRSGFSYGYIKQRHMAYRAEPNHDA